MNERRCFGCMRLTSQKFCEHCGWPLDGQNKPHQLPVGTVLQGKYMIGRVLGQGGFGITYLGWDMNLDIQVCIKEFYPSSTVNRDTTRSTVVNCNTTDLEGYYAACLERFLREGKALAKFRNVPQIVGIHDFFQMNNTAYMVMEFVSGIDLAKYVQRRGGRLHMDEILRIMRPIMEALQLVHNVGIIHRDISPDNIMLEPREGAKLLDFGAVRNVEHPDAEKELTRATEAILKNGFAPMEQYVAKGSLGPWTDVYAMSATIYYCLTGRIPEDAPIRLMEGTELDWTGAQGLTERQRAVLEQGMAPRAKDRIASIRELMDKLYAVEPTPVPVAPTQPQDPNKTEIVTPFKVAIPPETEKRVEEQTTIPVQPPAEPTFAAVQPGTQAASGMAEAHISTAPETTPPTKPKKGIFLLVALAVVVLAGVCLLFMRGKKQEPAEPQHVSTQPAEMTTEPVTAATEPPVTLSDEYVKINVAAGDYCMGGILLDGSGTVWQWDIATGIATETGVDNVAEMASRLTWNLCAAFLKKDGTVTRAEVLHNDNHEFIGLDKEVKIAAPDRIVRLYTLGASILALTETGEVYICGNGLAQKMAGLPAGIVDLQATQKIYIDTTIIVFLAKTVENVYYRWESDGADLSFVTPPEKFSVTDRDVAITLFRNQAQDDMPEVYVALDAYGMLRVVDRAGEVLAEQNVSPDARLYGGHDACFVLDGDSMLAFGRCSGGYLLSEKRDELVWKSLDRLDTYHDPNGGKQVREFFHGGWAFAMLMEDGTVRFWGQRFQENTVRKENGEAFVLQVQ